MRKLKSKSLTKERILNKVFINLFRIAIVAVIIFAVYSQNNYVTVQKYVYADSDLPKKFVGYKVVHISDICNCKYNIVSQVRSAKPDVIIISGGYEDKKGNYSKSVRVVEKLCSIAPVYYVYNSKDTKDCLKSTQATNISGNVVELTTDNVNVNTFIKENYGKSIIKQAKKGNEEAVEYIDYVSSKLAESQYSTLKLAGIGSTNNADSTKLIETANELLGYNDDDLTILADGNINNVNTLGKANIDIILAGGTFGKNDNDANVSKGDYTYHGTQLFVSGGIGHNTGIRIFNLPQIQVITLSDGTIEQKNPLEDFLDLFIKDVGTIFDNDEGFSEHKYTSNELNKLQ